MALARVTAGFIALMASSCLHAQTTYYVNGDCGDDAWTGVTEACGAPDGPKKTIGAAVDTSEKGDLVIVAPGTYPMASNSFSMRAPITVRSRDGPFATVLDGEKTNANISIDFIDAAPGVIEGFTVTRMDAFPAPIVMYNADLMLIDCRFIDNHGQYGGAVWNEPGLYADLTAINCVFQDNFGQVVGGVLAWSVRAFNCTFVGNTNDGKAKATAVFAAAYSDSLLIASCVFRGEPPLLYGYGQGGSVNFSNVQGGYDGGIHTIDADPMFVDEAAGDLRLLPGSPCIDAGNNAAVPEWVRTDIAGLERFIDDPATPDTGFGSAPIVDMGAHEFQAACYPDFNGDGALDLFDFLAYIVAFNAGEPAADCTADQMFDLFDFLCYTNAFNEGC